MVIDCFDTLQILILLAVSALTTAAKSLNQTKAKTDKNENAPGYIPQESKYKTFFEDLNPGHASDNLQKKPGYPADGQKNLAYDQEKLNQNNQEKDKAEYGQIQGRQTSGFHQQTSKPKTVYVRRIIIRKPKNGHSRHGQERALEQSRHRKQKPRHESVPKQYFGIPEITKEYGHNEEKTPQKPGHGHSALERVAKKDTENKRSGPNQKRINQHARPHQTIGHGYSETEDLEVHQKAGYARTPSSANLGNAKAGANKKPGFGGDYVKPKSPSFGKRSEKRHKSTNLKSSSHNQKQPRVKNGSSRDKIPKRHGNRKSAYRQQATSKPPSYKSTKSTATSGHHPSQKTFENNHKCKQPNDIKIDAEAFKIHYIPGNIRPRAKDCLEAPETADPRKPDKPTVRRYFRFGDTEIMKSPARGAGGESSSSEEMPKYDPYPMIRINYEEGGPIYGQEQEMARFRSMILEDLDDPMFSFDKLNRIFGAKGFQEQQPSPEGQNEHDSKRSHLPNGGQTFPPVKYHIGSRDGRLGSQYGSENDADRQFGTQPDIYADQDQGPVPSSLNEFQENAAYSEDGSEQDLGNPKEHVDKANAVTPSFRFSVNLPPDDYGSEAKYQVEQDKRSTKYSLDQTHPHGGNSIVEYHLQNNH